MSLKNKRYTFGYSQHLVCHQQDEYIQLNIVNEALVCFDKKIFGKIELGQMHDDAAS